MELEPIGKQSLNRNASGKLKQHLYTFVLSSCLQCLSGCFWITLQEDIDTKENTLHIRKVETIMKNRIKKAITITLATLTVIGNTFTPVQARCTDVTKNAPITKVINCNDLTEKMLTHRSNKKHHIMYIECIVGRVTDNKKNGKVLNPPKDGGYYISYASVKGQEKGI